MKNKILLTLLVSFLTFPSAQAIGVGEDLGISPFHDWKSMETEHFRLTFPKELAPVAERAANLYEQAHAALSVEMRWEAHYKVSVLLLDNSDAANGLTTPISRFGMLLYLTPPDSFFSTTYYDDWLKLLIFHEYTHFLNMDATRALYSALRLLFGDVILPNSFWPAWMLEGLAVYDETKYTRLGRGRSPYYEMILRTAVENGNLGTPALSTLDQINGPHPDFPGGETRYLFGYQLMNQIDRQDPKATSEMTERSSWRVPFFINGNLENITGKDWYQFWSEWVEETKTRMTEALAKIHAQPVTRPELLDEKRDQETIGVAASPDGQWLAFSRDSADHWQTLYLRDLHSGKTQSLEDKFYGSGLSFSHDSKIFVYSTLHRLQTYNFVSDLKVHELANGRTYFISHNLRAKDPDVSPKGGWITFTGSYRSGTSLYAAQLKEQDGRLTLTGIRRLLEATNLDRIANPRWSPDGGSIVYTYKKNGELGERLERIEVATLRRETLVANDAQNRFPAYDSKGRLHFISDQTGVDNLYRLDSGRAVMVTNVTSGLWLPAFQNGVAYVSYFTPDGWALAKIPESELKTVNAARAQVAPPPAPKFVETPTLTANYEVKDYSIWPSILPRQWAPLAILSQRETYIGGQILGYDAVDRHRYLLLGAYSSVSKSLDYYTLYSNRVLGPTLDLYASKFTQNATFSSGAIDALPTSFTSKRTAGAALYFPFRFTTSSLTPRIGVGLERESAYGLSSGSSQLIAKSLYVPTTDASLTWTDTRSSPLGVAPERGRQIFAGVRRYQDSDRVTYKGIYSHAEYFHLGHHFVLSPSVKGEYDTKVLGSNFTAAAVQLSGHVQRLFNPYPSDDFDVQYIRGYGGVTVVTKSALTTGLDLRFPVAEIFRGWGTNPIFLNQLVLGLFGENTYLPDWQMNLGSVGGSLRLNTEILLNLPVSFTLYYQNGFNRAAFGQSEIFFAIGLNTLSFGL